VVESSKWLVDEFRQPPLDNKVEVWFESKTT